ncbi:hypothetical protein FBUS_07999 [Fasciolopsis buskii]|uniref:Uncharacterized protein n=1 Tax=Fasciolopsis buskii TaxID=27845 RepID=A0A8E0RVE1_9TREM|nr:hypothetical protein FBUS_07999 [Fasciolopsis buski]
MLILFASLVCHLFLQVSHINKPLPANLVDIVNDMLSSPNCKFFVLDKLVPTVVLVTGHRQCSFIINLIGKLSFDDKSRLLHTLCNSTSSWPLETFPIIQNLLDMLTDEAARDLLIQVAERHNTFLRGPLVNLITSCKTTTQ